MSDCRLINAAPVLAVSDLRRSVEWYKAKAGFHAVEHLESDEPFAALYRDAVEIILVQAQFGTVERNRVRYGAGYDLFLAPESPEQVDTFHAELAARDVRIIRGPALAPYGVREFVFEDADGRWIGVGCIQDEGAFLSPRRARRKPEEHEEVLIPRRARRKPEEHEEVLIPRRARRKSVRSRRGDLSSSDFSWCPSWITIFFVPFRSSSCPSWIPELAALFRQG